MLRGGRKQGGIEGGKGWDAVSFKTYYKICDAFIRISPAKLVYFDPDSDLSGMLSHGQAEKCCHLLPRVFSAEQKNLS